MSAVPEVQSIGKLAAAIALVSGAIGVVEETGRNKSEGYNYASDADLKRRLAPLLGEHGLAIIPIQLDTDWDEVKTRNGGTQFRCRMRAVYLVAHSSGESMTAVSLGEGISSRDKAAYIAQTGAHKYLVRTLFSIPTGDDAEKPEDAPAAGLDENLNTWPKGKGSFDNAMRGALGLDKAFDITWVYDWALVELQGQHIGNFSDVRRHRMLEWLATPEVKERWAIWLLNRKEQEEAEAALSAKK